MAFVDGNSGGVGASQIFVCAVGQSVLLCGPFPGLLAGESRFFLRIFFFLSALISILRFAGFFRAKSRVYEAKNKTQGTRHQVLVLRP